MNYAKALASIIGTIIGAGIFAVPFVMNTAGFISGSILFFGITLLLLLLHLMYAEVVERTDGNHRLMGYTRVYFGEKAKKAIAVSVTASLLGALIVYILLANDFLNSLIGPVGDFNMFWGFIFWAFLSAAIIRGIKAVSRAEVFMLIFLIAVLAVIMIAGAGHVDVSNLKTFNFTKIFIPYGVILFSLAGFQAIPEISDMLKNKRKVFRRSVIWGTLLAALFTYAFAFVVVGVSGSATTDEAIKGLAPYLGNIVVYLGAVLGVLAVGTSYLILGSNMRDSLILDWDIKPLRANTLIVGAPMGLILLGVQNFILVLGLVGALFGAVNGTMTAFLFLRSRGTVSKRPSFSLNIPNGLVYFAVVALILGGIYETIKIIIQII